MDIKPARVAVEWTAFAGDLVGRTKGALCMLCMLRISALCTRSMLCISSDGYEACTCYR